tara:strand:- start:3558 stop:3821 length:264 start_codon:yes stop_codon:yes gene_type:complete
LVASDAEDAACATADAVTSLVDETDADDVAEISTPADAVFTATSDAEVVAKMLTDVFTSTTPPSSASGFDARGEKPNMCYLKVWWAK